MRRILGIVLPALFAALVVAIATAGDERTVDRHGDRTKSARSRGAETPVEATFSPQTRFMPFESRISGIGATNKAAALLAVASRQGDEQAIATLHRLLQLRLPVSEENDKILAETHRRLGDLYEGRPSKQVLLYGTALRHAADPVLRSRLESRIAELGGDLFAIAFGRQKDAPIARSRDAGPDDTCPGAVPVVVGAGTPYSEVMDVSPPGDHNWRSFDNPGPDGWAVRIETISDNPGTFEDDTDLGLWDGCPEDGGQLIAFSDDKPFDFTSLIQTECSLFPGSYFVEVGGFFDTATPDDFTLEIEVTGVCTVPSTDAFEPDDDRGQANSIGLPTSTPPHAYGWGRARKEIQAHSVFPAADRDHVIFDLTRNELVRMSTKGQHPTFFNDFVETDPLDNPDTILQLFYEDEPDYGGRCNQPDDGFLPVCFSDDDCPDPLSNPLPGFPPCIPIQLFNVPVGFENPLALNDDRGAGDLGSELLLCLPPTTPSSTALYPGGDWIVRVSPFSPMNVFDYEIQVKNEVACLYEIEPNNGCETAQPIELGRPMHAVYDFVTTNPFADADLYRFDVEETSVITLETLGYDSIAVDTAFKLFAGCVGQCDPFIDLNMNDDDGGQGFLSKLQLTVPPANDLIGVPPEFCDADYFLNVTSLFYNPNFPYTLDSTVDRTIEIEQEPNEDCASPQTIELGDRVLATIGPNCDYDSYKFTLASDTFITVATPSGGDTAIQLHDCADDSVLACDDDSGPGLLPLIDGCLPAGDYCARVRAFSGAQSFSYDLELSGVTGCTPTDPPSISGDGAFTCLDFDGCVY